MALIEVERTCPIRVAVIGATGSVGSSVLDICRQFSAFFKVTVLAAKSNADGLEALAKEFRPEAVVLIDARAAAKLRGRLAGKTKFFSGPSALEQMLAENLADHVVFASSGTDAIRALVLALDASLDVSLANKESLVVAGEWVMPRVRFPHQLRPLDSEHSAIWQCMLGETSSSVDKIWLTASGGPFRDFSLRAMKIVKPEDALNHPVWSMGAKVTIDSATLMNKGIEVIEAMRLFDLEASRVEAVIHRNSLVHGLVAFKDGTVKALLSKPDMRLPVTAALAYPKRLDLENAYSLPSPEHWAVSFEAPDMERFPCYRLAREAALAGGGYPAILVGADEVAVEAFLNKIIPFTSIAAVVEATLSSFNETAPRHLDDALDLLDRARRRARDLTPRFSNERGYFSC